MTKPIISTTGIINGRGQDKYKWVSGLTAEERKAVRDGKIVLIKDDNPHPACTEYKIVKYAPVTGAYYHRNYNG
jgi:hypothetical protein